MPQSRSTITSNAAWSKPATRASSGTQNGCPSRSSPLQPTGSPAGGRFGLVDPRFSSQAAEISGRLPSGMASSHLAGLHSMQPYSQQPQKQQGSAGHASQNPTPHFGAQHAGSSPLGSSEGQPHSHTSSQRSQGDPGTNQWVAQPSCQIPRMSVNQGMSANPNAPFGGATPYPGHSFHQMPGYSAASASVHFPESKGTTPYSGHSSQQMPGAMSSLQPHPPGAWDSPNIINGHGDPEDSVSLLMSQAIDMPIGEDMISDMAAPDSHSTQWYGAPASQGLPNLQQPRMQHINAQAGQGPSEQGPIAAYRSHHAQQHINVQSGQGLSGQAPSTAYRSHHPQQHPCEASHIAPDRHRNQQEVADMSQSGAPAPSDLSSSSRFAGRSSVDRIQSAMLQGHSALLGDLRQISIADPGHLVSTAPAEAPRYTPMQTQPFCSTFQQF